MNYIEVTIKRDSTAYTSTLSNLTLNDVSLLGTFNPSGTTPKTSNITGFHLGSGFKLSGIVDLTGAFSNCAGACDVEIRFGALPSQIVVNKTVSGFTPTTAWQFAGPKGAFSVPNIGGTSVITPLGSSSYAITETIKPGFVASTSCTNGASGSNSVSVTPDAGATITCTFANTISPVYSTITVTPAMTQGWASFAEPSPGAAYAIPFDIQSLPAPATGIGNPTFVLTQTNVGKLYASAILTGAKLSDLLVLTYSTYLETGGQVPTIQIGWDDNSTDGNTGFRGRLVFVPSGTTNGAWQTWNALSDTAGTWYTTLAGTCNINGGGCTWSTVLSTFPNATIHGNPSVPYGFVGVKAGSGGTGVSYFDGLTIAANQNVVSYDFEPVCSPYRVINMNTGEGFCTIQAAIDDANTVAGDTISVTAGVYTEAVNINKANLYLIGASGAASTTIVGPKIGAGNDSVLFSASGVTLDGFTITRDGNNPADWATNVRNQGVNMASTGGTLKNSIVTGNRNGVLITYADTQVISNNIVNNRTGIHIQGGSPNVTITNNIITGNWTIGILFRQDSSINSGWLIENNRVSDNWYSQLEDRGNPAGITRLIESNYWGNYPFTLTTTNTSGEPGYASQIPVQFGGSAVPPAGTPVFVVNPYDPNPNGDTGGRGNINTTRLDYEPWLCDGADTSPAIGFQPITTTLCNSAPPDTFISGAPISPTASNTATFVFSGADTVTPEALLTFECSLNGSAFGSCASPKDYTSLPDGLNTFAVRAVDPAGITDTTPATHTWLVDTTAPETSITSAPISPSAAITSVFTFTGTDVSGVAGFECQLNGNGWSACSSPITYTSGLTEGLNTFEVRAIDALSNTDASPATHTWFLDTTGPETTITSSPALTTGAPYATFAFTGTDVGGTGVAGFECSLDGVTFTGCTSPQVFTGIANGPHTFVVRAIDVVGNIDPTPATFTWLIDHVAPVTSITSAPSSPTSTTSASLTFTGTDAGGSGVAYFEYRLDGGAWLSTTNTTVNYTSLSNGTHQFDVRAVDNIGNVDLTYATTSWTVDAVAPDTSISSAPASLVLTSTATLVITGTDAGGSGVAYYEYMLDGGAIITTTSMTITFTGLSDGPHTFMVAAVDNVSNVDVTPASATWTVDTAEPNTTITITPTTPTSSTVVSIPFTGSDGGSGVASFRCSLDGSTPVMCSSPASYISLSDSSHTFSVFAIDNVGNADSTPASVTWVVDTTAPSVNITSAPASPTNTNTAEFSFTGNDAGVGIAGYECKLDAGAWVSCVSPANYTSLSDGTHTFQVRALDAVNNTDTPASHTWTMDTTGPTATITSAPISPTITTTAVIAFTGNDGSGVSVASFECSFDGSAFATCTSPQTFAGLGDGLHTFSVRAIDTMGNTGAPVTATWVIDILPPDTTITITPTTPASSTAVSIAFAGSDSGSGVASFMCSLDDATPASCASPFYAIGLADGNHVFEVYAVDNVGNRDPSPAVATWTVDSTPPDTSITASPASQTNTASATFDFTGADSGTGVAGFECKLDAGAWASCVSPTSYTSLSEGTHTFQVRALDAVGNVDSTPASFTWLVDTVAPDAIITIAPASLISSTSASVTFTATDGAGSGLASFECQLDSGGYNACTSPVTLNSLSDGLHMFDVRAIDNVGNVETSPASAAFTVDATLPTTTIDIAPPAIDSSNASFSFSGGDGTGSGVTGFECKLDGGAWAACASPVAYLSLSAGSHTFEVRAIDNAGNVDASPASHTWAVDGDLPNTEIMPTLPAATASTSVSIVFIGTDSTTPAVALTFECSFDGSVFAACTSPFTQSSLAQGTHTFNVRAIDEGNNVDPSPATATWLVDTAMPDTNIISAPPAITGSNSAVITFIGSDALAPASSLTYECSVDGDAWSTCTSPVALISLSNGNHTFNVRAIDTAGNVDTTPASVSWLVDATAPNTFIMSQPANPTAQTSASFTFSSTGSLSAVTYECRLDGGAWAACLTPNVITGLSDGSHTLEVRATSAAGLTDATPASYTWVVDATAPDTTITAQPPAVSGSSVSFSFNGSDGSGTGIASFECKLDAGAWGACSSAKAYSGLNNGSHAFNVRAIDNAGVVDTTPATYAWTVDSNLPETLLLNTPPANSPNSSASFTFIGTDDSAPSSAIMFECRLDGGAWSVCTSPKTYTGLNDGSHTVEVRSVDSGGNADPTPSSSTWTVDTHAPDTTITSGPMTTTFDTIASLVFNGTDVTNAPGSLTFECRVDGSAWSTCSRPKVLAALTIGLHVFEVRAIDQAGNADPTQARFQWTIVDRPTVLLLYVYMPIVMNQTR